MAAWPRVMNMHQPGRFFGSSPLSFSPPPPETALISAGE